MHYFRDTHPIIEGTKQTESLAGTTFVQAANLDYKGNKVLMFVFSVRVFSLSLCTPVSCLLRMLARRTDARTRVGPRGKGRGQLYTPIPLLRPLLSRRRDGRTDARLG